MLNRKVLTAVVVVAVLANASAYVFNLYDRLFWVDKALHFYTSLVGSLVLGYLWRKRLVRPLRPQPLVLALSLASLTLALGVLWEIGEWMADVFSSQNVIQGKTDTIVDLILDAAGALAGAWLALPAAGTRRKRRSPLSVTGLERGMTMTQERKDRPRRDVDRDAAGAQADEATGQIPTAPNPSADEAREQSGQGPTRGVGERKERK